MENNIVSVLAAFCLLASFADCHHNAHNISIGARNGNELSNTFFLYDPFTESVSIVNTTSSIAGVWDPSRSLTSIFNGINGSAIIYNFRNNSGVYMPGGSFYRTWNSTIEDWPSYFCNLSLSELYNQTRINGTFFTEFNVTRQIVGEVSNALSNWSEFQNSSLDPLQSLTNISNALSDLYNGTIQGFFSTSRYRVLPIRNIFRLLQFFRGMSIFYNSIRGGIDWLRNRNFTFDPIPLLRARNGIEALVTLLRSLQFSYNLNEMLNGFYNSEANVLRLVTLLGGNVCSGVDGFLRAMYEQVTIGYPVCFSPFEIFWQEALANEWQQSINSFYDITRSLGSGLEGLRRLARRLFQRRNNPRNFI